MKAAEPWVSSARIGAVVVACLVTSAGSAAADGNVKAGKALTQQCEACHGADGLSKIPEAPNIAGQLEAYMIKQLTAFKSGERQNDMMSLIVPKLSEQDIADLAAYYSAVQITVGKLPGE